MKRLSFMNETRWFALGIVGLTLLVFREILLPGQALFSTDDNLGSLVMRKNALPEAWLGGWHSLELVGFPMSLFINCTNLLLFIFPATFFNNWINAFDLAVGSFFLYLFLRGRGLSWPACVFGLLTAYWVGSNLTLVYAGHIGKFGILLWVPCFLWCVDIAVRRKSIPLAILAGGALGAMFLEQADVAFFFALALGPYALFAWWREHGLALSDGAKCLIPLFGTAFLLAVQPLLAGYGAAVEGIAAVQEDSKAKWEFVTQWSWPPEESIDFIAPGYTGWRTGEPAGPYTGRMGRSANWEETGQGFRNFKLENQYLGAIPLLFAIVSIYLAVRRRTPDRREIMFWSAVTLIALLLSFGKHFPLYALFYQLPIVSSIRNPNKFLQVFQFALAVLTAYGVQALWIRAIAEKRRAVDYIDWRPVLYSALAVASILLLWSFSVAASSDRIIAALQEEWGRFARAIVETRISALVHGAIMTLIAAAGFFLLTRARVTSRSAHITVSALIVVMVFDVCWLARHYVKPFESGSLARNEVIELIQSSPSGARVALITQDGFYNNWLSFLFPYHEVESINVAQMPRMPVEYERYLNAVARNPLRHWELGGVGWILAPAEIWGQIANDPSLQGRFDLSLTYRVDPSTGGVTVVPGNEPRPGTHVVLRHKAPSHRYAFLAGWDVVDDDMTLRRLSAPNYQAFQRVLVASGQDAARELPPSPAATGVRGDVERVEHRSGHNRFRVTNEEPGILRIAEKFDPDWHATVNDEPVPVLRVDYLMQGVYLEPGIHEVELRYAPPLHTLWVQFAGLLICVLAAAQVVVSRRKIREGSGSD